MRKVQVIVEMSKASSSAEGPRELDEILQRKVISIRQLNQTIQLIEVR